MDNSGRGFSQDTRRKQTNQIIINSIEDSNNLLS